MSTALPKFFLFGELICNFFINFAIAIAVRIGISTASVIIIHYLLMRKIFLLLSFTMLMPIFAVSAFLAISQECIAGQYSPDDASAQEYSSDILKALDLKGKVKTASYYSVYEDQAENPESYEIRQIGFYPDGTPIDVLEKHDSYSSITGYGFTEFCLRDSFGLTFDLKDNRIARISMFVYGMPPYGDFEVTEYDSTGRPCRALACGETEVLLSYSDLDKNGNWTQMDIKASDQTANSDIHFPHRIIRRTEYWPEGASYSDVTKIPSDEDICRLMQKANLLADGTLSCEMDSIARQCIDANNMDLAPGSRYSNAEPFTLLYTGEEVPVLAANVEYKASNALRDKIKVEFNNTEEWDGRTTENNYVMAILKYEDGNWKIDDIGKFNEPPYGAHAPDTWVKASMLEFLGRFNKDVMDGTAESQAISAAEQWGMSPEDLDKAIEHILDYKDKYLVKRVKIELPDDFRGSVRNTVDAGKALGGKALHPALLKIRPVEQNKSKKK